MPELGSVLNCSGPVMDRGKRTQEMGRRMGSTCSSATSTITPGAQHLGGVHSEQAAVDALADRLSGDAADKAGRARWRVATDQVQTDPLGQGGIGAEVVLAAGAKTLGPSCGIVGPVQEPAAVSVRLTLDRRAVPTKQSTKLGPGHRRVLSQAAAARARSMTGACTP